MVKNRSRKDGADILQLTDFIPIIYIKAINPSGEVINKYIPVINGDRRIGKAAVYFCVPHFS
jgi:hypothetical protein